MSHSQFHRIMLILRHAWLNLWDKHMTTGRINQVAWDDAKHRRAFNAPSDTSFTYCYHLVGMHRTCVSPLLQSLSAPHISKAIRHNVPWTLSKRARAFCISALNLLQLSTQTACHSMWLMPVRVLAWNIGNGHGSTPNRLWDSFKLVLFSV